MRVHAMPARVLAAVAVATVAAGTVPALAAAQHARHVKTVHLGPNLLPNPSFEKSELEPAPVPQYTTSQPMVPVGWAFEGFAGLFDHSQNEHHTGKRAVGISDPAGVPRSETQQGQTVQNPLNGPKDTAAEYVSVVPSWRTRQAVPVKAGTTYQLSVYVKWALQTTGTGARTAIRWVDANGVPVAIQPAAKLTATMRTPNLSWTKISAVVKAPKGAAGAEILLGDDDTFISQLVYDDAYFGTYTLR